MSTTNNFEFPAPTELVEHPLHAKFFLAQEKKKKTTSYHESIGKYGKINQVIYVEVNGQKQVIDGWGYVMHAIERGLSHVAAQRIDLTDDEDIIRVMLELQFSDHGTPEEEYKMYNAAYDILSKGKGHRSDLDDTDDTAEAKENKKRRDSLYDRIAAMTNAASGKRVQCILKVGKINPLYFERMEIDRMSLHSAYTNCKSEEDNEEPKAPPVKAPVIVTRTTAIPQYSAPNTTFKKYAIQKWVDAMGNMVDEYMPIDVLLQYNITDADFVEETQTDVLQQYNITDTQPIENEYDVPDYFNLSGICEHCGKPTNIKIHINDLAQQWNKQI